MKTLALLAWATLGCSIDWSLARQASPSAASGGTSGAGGTASTQSIMIRCEEVLPLASAPVIDGVLEPSLATLRWLDETSTDVPPGIRVAVALAYRPEGVYFYVDVEDPTRDPAPLDALDYCGDGVELYVDDDGVIQAPPAYDSPGTMQFIVAAPVDTATPAHRGQRFTFPNAPGGDSIDLGDWTSDDFIAVPSARGYAVEAFVMASDLDRGGWTLAPGAKIGWNMSFNVGGPQPPGIDACTTRNQQFHLRLAGSGSCTPPYCNASALCTPTLAAE
jgi:hypothetical protein